MALLAVRAVDHSFHMQLSSAAGHYRMRARLPRGAGFARHDAYADAATSNGSRAVTGAARFAIMAG